jgi:hypothetical protein
MRILRLSLSLALLVSAAVCQTLTTTSTDASTIATQTITASSATDQSVPSAPAILGQMLRATGWNQTNLPADLIGQSTLTFPDGSTRSLKIQSRGLRQHSLESSEHKVILNGEEALSIIGSKRIWLPAAAMNRWHFPFVILATDLADPALQSAYLGNESLSEPAVKIKIWREPTSGDLFPVQHRMESEVILWIATASSLPLQIQYGMPTLSNPLNLIPHMRKFLDYRPLGSMLVPYRQSESVEGDPVYDLEFTSITLNNGLTDSDFAFPTAALPSGGSQ